MTEFTAFFQIGFYHIINMEALDHLLFLLVLCAVYQFNQWKKVLVLVTAFTIGHSITLLLTVVDYLYINNFLVELMIPFTIVGTALMNLLENPYKVDTKGKLSIYSFLRYFLALCFGLIHGLAFAKDLKSLFLLDHQDILLKLLAFNLGIEGGQILAVCLILMLSTLLGFILHQKTRWVNYTFSGLSACIALLMIFERVL